MYLYFNQNGVLKEIINDDALREGSSNINKVYVYCENQAYEGMTAHIKYSDDTTETAILRAVTSDAEKEIPYNPDRDLKYFKYDTPYPFFAFTFGETFVIDDTTYYGPPLTPSGMTTMSIVGVDLENQQTAFQGLVVFNIEGSVQPDVEITQAQFEYLTGKISAIDSDVANLEADLALKQDEANISQSLDNSETKYPSNKAVKTAVDGLANDISGLEGDVSDIKLAYVVSAEIVASGDHEGELKIVVAVNGEPQSPIYFEGGSDAVWGNITGTLADQTDLNNALNGKQNVIDSSNKLSASYVSGLANVATTGDYDDLSDKPDLSIYAESADLAPVATSGSYDDLLGKPTIPAAQVNSDWNASTGVAQILNKPTIPTKTSDLINDGEGVSGTDYQFASKNFVNSSVSTNTAFYLGSANQVSDLHLDYDADRADVADELASFFTSPAPTNNDYCFVQVPTSNATPTQISRVDRYKYNSQMSSWVYEYTLNNSSFTAAQWDAINSGITTGKVSSYDSHLSNISNPHSVTAAQVGLSNVDNTSDATKKSNFTGSIASGNTGFATGGDVYTELAGKQNTIDSSHKLSADLVDDTNATNKFVTASDKTTWNNKSVVSVSDTGTATDEVNYITVNGTEKKLAGGATVTFVDWS